MQGAIQHPNSMAAPYQVRLDPENARELATRGATIVLLDVPEGTAVGIDHQTFLVGPKFKGVKMIPPGVHAVTYASSSIDSYGPTTAFFTSLRGSEVAVWRWAPTEEVLHRVNDESQLAGITAAVKNFQLDENLAPYDLASYPLWRQLAGKVTPGVLDRVTPIGGNINILAEAPPAAASTPAEQALEEHLQQGREARRAVQAGQVTGSLSDPNEQAVGANPSPSTEAAAASGERAGERAEDLHPTLAAPHAGRCFFTPLPRLVKRQGLSPAELTALNLDKSGVLEDLLVKKFGGSEDDFLGEFQFAFLAFLLGHSLAGFSQWKDFLRLMFGCEDAAVGGRSRLFAAFLNALHAQLVHSLAPVRNIPYYRLYHIHSRIRFLRMHGVKINLAVQSPSPLFHECPSFSCRDALRTIRQPLSALPWLMSSSLIASFAVYAPTGFDGSPQKGPLCQKKLRKPPDGWGLLCSGLWGGTAVL